MSFRSTGSAKENMGRRGSGVFGSVGPERASQQSNPAFFTTDQRETIAEGRKVGGFKIVNTAVNAHEESADPKVRLHRKAVAHMIHSEEETRHTGRARVDQRNGADTPLGSSISSIGGGSTDERRSSIRITHNSNQQTDPDTQPTVTNSIKTFHNQCGDDGATSVMSTRSSVSGKGKAPYGDMRNRTAAPYAWNDEPSKKESEDEESQPSDSAPSTPPRNPAPAPFDSSFERSPFNPEKDPGQRTQYGVDKIPHRRRFEHKPSQIF